MQQNWKFSTIIIVRLRGILQNVTYEYKFSSTEQTKHQVDRKDSDSIRRRKTICHSFVTIILFILTYQNSLKLKFYAETLISDLTVEFWIEAIRLFRLRETKQRNFSVNLCTEILIAILYRSGVIKCNRCLWSCKVNRWPPGIFPRRNTRSLSPPFRLAWSQALWETPRSYKAWLREPSVSINRIPWGERYSLQGRAIPTDVFPASVRLNRPSSSSLWITQPSRN